MSESGPNLVTTYAFKGGKEYITKMRITASRGGIQRSLELTVTDKYTGEDWRSSYDTAYIENLTHKTGNYKQFDVFVTMLQSGLLKTSDSISLDLLTFGDLELLRTKQSDNSLGSSSSTKTSNRRYLILTYTVEFDRIHYPLPLEYCGPPDPAILQATIRKLESEIDRLHTTGVSREIQQRVEQLSSANRLLIEDNRKLSNTNKGVRHLLGTIKSLETNVAREREIFRARIQKLQTENVSLSMRIRQLSSGKKPRDPSPIVRKPGSAQSRKSVRRTSRSPSISRSKPPSISPAGSFTSLKSRYSPRSRGIKLRDFGAKEIDFGNLESRIHTLQKMLKEGINLN